MEMNDKKQLILEKTEQLFAEHGFSGTSVREIAKAADVNVAMISYYFGSKEKLLMEIFRFRGNYLETKIDALLNDTTLSGWDKIDILIEHYVQKTRGNKCLYRIIQKEVDMNSDSEISLFIQQRKKEHLRIISRFILQGQQLGQFSNQVDILCLHTLLVGFTKQVLFSQDFMRVALESQTGKSPSEDDLVKYAKDYLKSLFRKILEIK